MERVGSFGDGGKWICGMSQYAAFEERPLVVYSFGVDEDSSFEAELVDRTSAYVYAFDYTVDDMGPEITNGSKTNVKFSKIGLGGSDQTVDGNRFMTLPSIMSELGHDYVDILKMDVEGAEFDALDVLMETYNGSSLPFGQLMIEFHLWAAPQNIRDLVAWWERLENFGLRPVAQESNPLGVILGPGYPCCYEVRNYRSTGKHILTKGSMSLSTLEMTRTFCSYRRDWTRANPTVIRPNTETPSMADKLSIVFMTRREMVTKMDSKCHGSVKRYIYLLCGACLDGNGVKQLRVVAFHR